MIALMELTCANSVKDQLEDNQSTVGTLVNVQHLSATPLGMKV
jgi:predicted thioesterase